MPRYEYACQKCGHTLEISQSMKDAPLSVCPKDLCPKKTWGKGAIKRGVGGGAGIIFKGSGFYITDYRSEGYKAAAKKETDGAKPVASSDAKPAAKSDSKPQTKAESKPPAKSTNS